MKEGVWVVGMILGSPAQLAGMEQGDQLLQIDESLVDGQSPFQAATAISGGDAEPDTVIDPTVRLQVRLPILRICCFEVKLPVQAYLSEVHILH